MSSFQKQRTGRKNRSCLGVGTCGKGKKKESVYKGECSGNITYSCLKMEK
jgi:hypothetical protein